MGLVRSPEWAGRYWWSDTLEDLTVAGEQADGPELDRILRLIEIELCLTSTLHMGVKLGGGNVFTLEGAKRFKAYPHIRYLCWMIDRFIAGELDESGLMVTMPPQHGKSTTVSKKLPVRYLAANPDHRLLLTSYEDTKASRWGREVRNLITAREEWLGISISADSKAVNRWQLDGFDGSMICAGVGGPLTGEPGELIIIDDPVKNREEANSEPIQSRNWEWYTDVVMTREQADSKVLLVMTRWSEGDLGGMILEEEPEDWRVVNLPAIAGDDDVLGRKPGEALCEELHPLEKLLKQKRRMRSRFAAIYQGTPTAPEGHKFKRSDFRYATVEHADEAYYRLAHTPDKVELVRVADCFRFSTVDVAATEKKSADWTVVSTWDLAPIYDGDDPTALILVDRRRVRVEVHLPLLVDVHKVQKPNWIGVEKATYGLAVIKAARRHGLPVRKLKAESDKVSRSETAQTWLQNHRVFFPRGADWLSEWEHELLLFPNGRFDDQVDTLGYAAIEADKIVLPDRRQPEPSSRQRKARRLQHRNQRHPVLGRF